MRPPPILSESSPAEGIAALRAPSALRIPVRLEIHGDVRIDDYFWLREKSNPDVIAYLEEENRYADAIMAPTVRLQETLYREMLSHVKETDVSVPYRENGYLYYARTEEGKQYPIFCRRRGSREAPEEVTLDGNALAEGKPFLAIGDYAISDDGNLLAYSIDERGDRDYTLHVKNLVTGEMVGAPIEATSADSVVWGADGATIFYAILDAAKRPYRFCRRRLGARDHQVMFEEEDERFDLGAFRSRSGRFVFLSSGSHTSSEVRFAEASDPDAEFRLV